MSDPNKPTPAQKAYREIQRQKAERERESQVERAHAEAEEAEERGRLREKAKEPLSDAEVADLGRAAGKLSPYPNWPDFTVLQRTCEERRLRRVR